MKAKKAVKRLVKVEALLSNVLDQYSTSTGSVRELLDTAKASVIRAKESIDLMSAATTAKKPSVKAKEPKQGRLTAEGRKKISIAAKKRWADARRKGIHPLTGRRLSKTA